jgi:uncharacterized protein with HEPN domain
MEKSKKYLSDILMAIELIEEFTVGINNFNLYESAVERQLAIIGEALNQLRKNEPTILIENDKQIIAFRNRLIHAYDSLDNSIIWAIINRNIKSLKIEIQNLV